MRLILLITIITLLSPVPATFAANPYTEKQLESFAQRVGKTFWVRGANGKTPHFFTTEAPSASTLQPTNNESFEITDLTNRNSEHLYYKARFESGKIGYISVDAFHEELNVTILTIDPLADEKRKAELKKDEDKKRVDWIQSQPWSPQVKEAAIKRQPTPGLTTSEVRKVLGAPKRIVKTHGPTKISEEHWYYADNSVLTFQNGLLSKLERLESK